MSTILSDLQKITSSESSRDSRRFAMRGLARQLDWTPSYEFQATFGSAAAEDHLVVEHGLDTSAVITFLRAPYTASDISQSDLRNLLSISYNNLVEWHLFVSQSDIRQVSNLSRGPQERIFPVSSEALETRLSAAEVFQLRTERGAQRSLKGCDDALIDVITRWKRLLKADYPDATNSQLSALFNFMIFVRGCEDRNFDLPNRVGRPLYQLAFEADGAEIDFPKMLGDSLRRAGIDQDVSDFVDAGSLSVFSRMDRQTAENLVRDFYIVKDSQYDFNFGLMSKHALSRIYERYVALFDDNARDDRQATLFGVVPNLMQGRKGSIYTPQFIAGFFTRYVKENTTPRSFRSMRYIDPACGSGIFLRTMLEAQSNPLESTVTRDSVSMAFAGAEGIDKDANAVAATKLSLALLFLVSTGALPDKLLISESDAIEEAMAERLQAHSYDVVLSNPPYIKLDHLSEAERTTYEAFLGDAFKGRLDSYLAFIRLALGLANDDGFVCLVLPHAFLSAGNAGPLRRLISENFDIRCLVDLSAVSVFEGVGAYSILLILQRRSAGAYLTEDAVVAQVMDYVGPALQACLEGRQVSGPYHKVFRLPQAYFQRSDWSVVDPAHLTIEGQLRGLPVVSDYLEVSQGYVSGLDDVFIRDASEVVSTERAIYQHFLPDKDIRRFGVADADDKLVFYPFEADKAVDEVGLQKRYPATWAYLHTKREVLSARGPVRKGSTAWWRPERPREPRFMRRPKIVTPHLSLTPRFAVDIRGRYAVSRSPFLVAKQRGDDELTLLCFFCAVLNSSVVGWYLNVFSPKYASGYNRIESNLLRTIPVPDLARIETSAVVQVSKMVQALMSSVDGDDELEAEIDATIVRLYGLRREDIDVIMGRSERDDFAN